MFFFKCGAPCRWRVRRWGVQKWKFRVPAIDQPDLNIFSGSGGRLFLIAAAYANEGSPGTPSSPIYPQKIITFFAERDTAHTAAAAAVAAALRMDILILIE